MIVVKVTDGHVDVFSLRKFCLEMAVEVCKRWSARSIEQQAAKFEDYLLNGSNEKANPTQRLSDDVRE